ncbi:MAG: hypothetical protein V4613_00750 [Bacteroidota bacterium]
MDVSNILGWGLVIGIILVTLSKSSKGGKVKLSKPKPRRPLPEITPVENDKIIIIEHTTLEQVKATTLEFCDIYNSETYKCITKLTGINENKIALTFPTDIELEIFFFLVNFLDSYKLGQVTGLAKVGPKELNKSFAGKHVMVYVPANDKEGDNVYLTSEDGLGYKYGFSVGDKKTLTSPSIAYRQNIVDISTVVALNGEIIS